MEIYPEWLGMREEGVEARDEGCTPEVDGGPAVGEEFRGSGDAVACWLEHGEGVYHEETGVGDELDIFQPIVS